MEDNIKEGVYVKESVITIGTGHTAKKTVSKNYYYAKQVSDNLVEVDILNVHHQPVGLPEKIELNKFLKEYQYVADLETFQKQQKKLDPKKLKAEEHVKTGERHLENKEYNSAEYEFGMALKYDEKNLRAHHGLSKVYLETGQIEKAKEYLKKIGELEDLFDKENKHIFNEYAINLRKQGMYDEAIKNYKKAIAIDPEDEVLYYNLARAYYEKKEYDEAIKNLKKALELKPDFIEAKKALEFIKRKKSANK